MIYCDLDIGTTNLWSGIPGLSAVELKFYSYIPFIGELMFVDDQSTSDPFYEGLGTRFHLVYFPPELPNLEVPLDAVPSQQLSVLLNNQNCTLRIYEK